jgi:hypothetical protein
MENINEDCLRLIVKEFKNNELYSCILVNKFWCRTAIQVLWSNPFRFRLKNPLKLYLIILSFIPCIIKEKLINMSFDIPCLHETKKPSFNYFRFCSHHMNECKINSIFLFANYELSRCEYEKNTVNTLETVRRRNKAFMEELITFFSNNYL